MQTTSILQISYGLFSPHGHEHLAHPSVLPHTPTFCISIISKSCNSQWKHTSHFSENVAVFVNAFFSHSLAANALAAIRIGSFAGSSDVYVARGKYRGIKRRGIRKTEEAEVTHDGKHCLVPFTWSILHRREGRSIVVYPG